MYIIYGSCVRFYSTVVDWSYLQRMKEDLIERITTKVFDNLEFSSLVVSICRQMNQAHEATYLKRLGEVKGIKPRDVGISPFLTLDRTGNLEKVFMES
jgi:hypothetical protein